MTRVRLFLDFLEDRRFSMEAYAAELRAALADAADEGLVIDTFRPSYPSGAPLPTRWRDRFARYAAYPWQVRGQGGDVNHIIDHAYAHLMMSLPPGNTVVTVHDMIPFLAGRGLIAGGTRRRPWLNEFTMSFLRRAKALIAVSENTREDLIQHLGIPPGRVRAIPHGISPCFRVLRESRESIRRRLELPLQSTLVLISGTQFYKNHATSVRVLNLLRQQLPESDVRLVCMGRLTNDACRLAAETSLQPYIMQTQPTERDDVVALYNAVDCLLFPSLYEGFGWPPLEAMGCGLPVICSNAGSLPETVGDAAHVAEPLDAPAHAANVVAALSSDRKELAQKGLERAARYGWSNHAQAVIETYRCAMS